MMTKKGGAILLARSFLDSEIFADKPHVWTKIWLYILAKANFQDNGRFKRGELFTTYRDICLATRASIGETDHCIRWLKSAKQISTRKATRGLYIRALNYNIYQDIKSYKSDTKNRLVGDLKARQKRHRSDTKKNNDKNVIMNKNVNTNNTAASKEAGGSGPRYGLQGLGAGLARFRRSIAS